MRNRPLEVDGTPERDNEQAEDYGDQADEAQHLGRLLGHGDQKARHAFGKEKIRDALENERESHSDDKKRPVDVHMV